jgi:hypothetical protein
MPVTKTVLPTLSQTYSVNGFKLLCESHVVELVFNTRDRRNPRMRRMMCTLNRSLLNSTFGKVSLRFKPPSQTPPYNAESKGLVTVWDIFRQDWRNVPVKAAFIMPQPHTMKAEPVEDFIEYFDKVIRPMTFDQRKQFIEN